MKNSFFTVKTYGEKNRKVVFFLGGWGHSQTLLWPVSKILELAGFYCITYAFDVNILSPNLSLTVRHVLQAKRSILRQIGQLTQDGYGDFAVFGTSLGALISLLVTHESPQIKKVIFNIPGFDVAESLWRWDKKLISFKQELLKRYPTLDALKKEVEPINSSRFLNNLAGKDLLIYISGKDSIAISDPIQLKKLLQSYNYKFQLKINNFFDHDLTGLINLLNFPSYINFLSNG